MFASLVWLRVGMLAAMFNEQPTPPPSHTDGLSADLHRWHSTPPRRDPSYLAVRWLWSITDVIDRCFGPTLCGLHQPRSSFSFL